MKCPKCVADGLRSTISVGCATSTCMGVSSYYDEDGHYRTSDPNIYTESFTCSLGHRWTEQRQGGNHTITYENFTIPAALPSTQQEEQK